MSKSANIIALRITVIVLYALAMTVVGMARHDVSSAAITTDAGAFATAYVLPGNETAVFCQHGSVGAPDLPDGGTPVGDSCCDACLMSHAPGVSGFASAELVHPPIIPIVPEAWQAPDLVAVWRIEPVSRGPPAA